MLSKITKRDLAFDKKIKKLPADWILADEWKFILHHAQRDAAKSLFYANSNQHRVVHHIKRQNNRIIFSSQIVEKAYYIRYCVVLLQACGDKLAQMIRCSMDIKKWKYEEKKIIKTIKAKESNTTLMRLAGHLRLSGKKDKVLLSDIDTYLTNVSVTRILQLANVIKHKWITSYQGEGLYPSRTPCIQTIVLDGEPFETLNLEMSCGENINLHIRDALITNNKFVDLSLKVDNLFKERKRREYEENSFSC